jgi:Flp pilus assembly protein TadD
MHVIVIGQRLLSAALFLALAGCGTLGGRADLGISDDRLPSIEQSLVSGKALIEREQYQDALRVFGMVLERDGNNVQAKLGVAEAHLGAGSGRMALAAYAAIADIDGLAPIARQGQGLSLVQLGDYDSAQPLLEAAVQDEPGAWRAWLALARCYDARRLWAESAAAYEKAAAANAKSYVPYNNWGMSLLSQSRFAEAEAKFAQALALRPDFETSRNNLRFALAMQGKYREAFAGVGGQSLPAVLNNVGYAALLRGDRDRARAYFTRALETSPHFLSIAHENLQTVERESGKRD